MRKKTKPYQEKATNTYIMRQAAAGYKRRGFYIKDEWRAQIQEFINKLKIGKKNEK